VRFVRPMTMLKIKFIDGEMFYYVFTNKGGNLILVTRDGRFATQTNAALKNRVDDSNVRIKLVRKRRKAA
jgi:flagellar basal body rod protein FlgG